MHVSLAPSYRKEKSVLGWRKGGLGQTVATRSKQLVLVDVCMMRVSSPQYT